MLPVVSRDMNMPNMRFHSRPWISAAALFGFMIPPASAADAGAEIEAGTTYEQLTNDKPDWKSLYLDASKTFAPRQTLYGTVRETERFELRDFEVAAGYSHPFGAKWTGVIEASHSPDHNVLAAESAFGQLYWTA